MALTYPDTVAGELMERHRSFSVFQQLRYAILARMKRGEDVIPLIQGRKEAKDDVIRALLSGSHPYLVSEEGTGKTRLVRSIISLLPPVPRIAGCPYNDDPLWHKERLCPRCSSVDDPVKEFGIEWISGSERFSRIQGNEYTNEAKLLGLKDIGAIASGMSPGDPRTFTGTGVFRANRGLLFIDELPAIRTKVQVLLHPVLEEGKTVLEEYGWEYPLDLCVVATGNPEGFSHVNEVPRPLVDRLETIYLDLPDEGVELGIMMSGRDRPGHDPSRISAPSVEIPREDPVDDTLPLAPWWLLTMINRAVRQSRACRWLERASSIRGTMRALDHTLSTACMRSARIANIEDAAHGVRLALRGRVHLRDDLVEIDDPAGTYRRVDEISGDLLRTALISMAQELAPSWDGARTAPELAGILRLPRDARPDAIMQNAPVTRDIIAGLSRSPADPGRFLHDTRIEELAGRDSDIRGQYVNTCAEFIANILIVSGTLEAGDTNMYIPREISWTQGLP